MPKCTCREWERWEGGPIDEATGEFLEPTRLIKHVDRCANCRGLTNPSQNDTERKQLMASMSTLATRLQKEAKNDVD